MWTKCMSPVASVKLTAEIGIQIIEETLFNGISDTSPVSFYCLNRTPLSYELLDMYNILISILIELDDVEETEETPLPIGVQDCIKVILSKEVDLSYLSDIFDAFFKGSNELQFTDDLAAFFQIQALFSKQKNLDLGVDKSLACKESFFLSEDDCRKANIRISENNPPSTVACVIHYAQQLISELLFREFPDGPPMIEDCDPVFGPGTNTSLRNSGPFNLRKKLGAKLSCSPNSIPIIGSMLEALPLLVALNVVDESDDRVTASVSIEAAQYDEVAKNWKTFRGMVVETPLSGMYQRCYGTFIRDALFRDGCNLKDQSFNQVKACKASLVAYDTYLDEEAVVTCDKTRASDCMANEAVWLLLPYQWAARLDELRSPVVVFPDKSIVKLEKFSSMGNGFTFELESLLFWGILKGAMRHAKVKPTVFNHGVYGDDVIIPAKAFRIYKETIEWLGFSINKEKTFLRGYFRESCGHDYFFGYNVRGFYLKEEWSPRTLYAFHNFLFRAGKLTMAERVKRIILRFDNNPLYGPMGYGDGHLIGEWEPIQNRSMKRSGWEVAGFATYKLTKAQLFEPFRGDPLLPSYSIYQKAHESTYGKSKFDEDFESDNALDDSSAPVDPHVCRGVFIDPETGDKVYKSVIITTLKKTIL